MDAKEQMIDAISTFFKENQRKPAAVILPPDVHHRWMKEDPDLRYQGLMPNWPNGLTCIGVPVYRAKVQSMLVVGQDVDLSEWGITPS